MDVPINTTGTEHTDVIMGSLGPGLTENMIEELVAKRQPELSAHEITVISSDKDQTCIFVVCLKTETERLEEALRAEGFTRMSYFSKRTPENKIKKYRLTIEGYEDEIEDLKNRLPDLQKAGRHLRPYPIITRSELRNIRCLEPCFSRTAHLS